MNLRHWSKYHTYGLIIGILSPLIFIPIVMGIYSVIDGTPFDSLWTKFKFLFDTRSKFISLACISNLIWFHLSTRKQNFEQAMGIILATFLYLFLILYYKL